MANKKENKNKFEQMDIKKQNKISENMFSNVNKTIAQWSIKKISEMVGSGILIDARYQRGDIWKPSMKKELMDTIIGYGAENVPTVTVRKLDNGKYEVVDGKQRVLVTIAPFVNDDAFGLSGISTPDLKGKTCSDLQTEAPIVYGALMNSIISVEIMDNMSEEEAITYFIRRNSSGVKVETGERIHAMSGTPLLKVLAPLKKHSVWDNINGKRRYNEYTHLSRMLLFVRDYEKYTKSVTCYDNKSLLNELEIYRSTPISKKWSKQVKTVLDYMDTVLTKSQTRITITQLYSVFLYINIKEPHLKSFAEFLPKLYTFVNTSKETDSGLFFDLKRRHIEKGYSYSPKYYDWYVNVLEKAFEAYKQGYDWNEIKRIHF